MSFLAINGVTFPVAAGSVSEAERLVGESSLAYDGTPRASIQAVKTDIALVSTPMSGVEALAWRSLLRGMGDVWSFNDNLYSSQGLGPSSSTGCSVDTTHVKFGAKSLKVAPGGAFVVAGIPTRWAIGGWNWNGAAMAHKFACSNGRGWLDGVRDDSVFATLSGLVAAGNLTLPDGGGAGAYWDDLIILPYEVPDAWPLVWGIAAAAFPPLADLALTGKLISEATTRVARGSADAKVLAARPNGVFDPAMRVLAVTLLEK